ncbi:uncharacterized protein LOC121784068 [Salvia splendens]|uniref:uncharacterized protein LOC121784068 n=1 Tax=Salvia splendens TaxID=180675 RepID=UPI001C2637A7|nr:uncharacterized protein LOC121784068 [Salvia splendens]
MQQVWMDVESDWPMKRRVNAVTIHTKASPTLPNGLEASNEKVLGTTIEDQSGSKCSIEGEKANKVDDQEDDLELCSMYTHLESDPPQAIIAITGHEVVYLKPHLLAVLPEFWGRSCDNPYNFLHEFYKLYKSQKRPVGSSEDDYRLRAIPFSLKGEANTWFMRLSLNSIKLWSDFKNVFLENFFPVAKTRTLRREIQEVAQGYDETLIQY